MRIWQQISETLSQPIGDLPIIGWHLVVIVTAIIPFVLVSTVFSKQWDRIPGVWRCVILSGIAHVLLIFYAYGTQYVIFSGPGSPSDGVAIQVIEQVESEPAPAATQSSIPSWDKFTNEQPAPAVEPLDRPQEEPELVIERTWTPTEIDTPPIETVIAHSNPESPTQHDSLNPDSLVPSLPPALAPEAAAPTQFNSDVSNLFPEVMSAPTPTPIETPTPEVVAAESPTFAGTFEGPDSTDPPPTETEPVIELPKLAAAPSFLPPPDFKPTELLEPSSAALPMAANFSATEGLIPLPSKLPGHIKSERNWNQASTPRRLGDSQPMPKIYSERAPDGRLEVAVRRGGSEETEAAVERGLKFLSAQQLDDGRWSSRMSGGGVERQVLGHDRNGAGARADMGITGLALLAFLSSGNTHYEGPYREEVGKGLQFLINSQATDGNLAGDAEPFARMYCHSMAMLAISEALAVTGDPNLLPAVRQAVNFSVRSQSPTDGGWRYQPGDAGDMSQFGWQVLSLHSASLGGIKIPNQTVAGLKKFLDLCSRGQHKGLGCYRPSEGPSVSMTAEALACRFLIEENVSAATIDEAATVILKNPPSRYEINYYYWYYGTMAMHHAGGRHWEDWNAQLKPVLLAHQNIDGPEAGSWPMDGLWAGYGGKVYSTALATLCLQAYYRYVPISELSEEP